MRKLLILFVLVACVPSQALIQCQTQMAVNRIHSQDALLPPEARDIAADAEDGWAAELYLLDGTRLPSHVEERMAARGKLPLGYE